MITEAARLEALQRRSSDVWEAYREQLAAHPDAIELRPEHIEHTRVVERAGALAGFSVVLPGEDGAWELDGLFVEPELMGGGLGRALVDDAARIARERGAASLAVTGNPHALEFYRRVGFTGIEEIATRFGRDGAWGRQMMCSTASVQVCLDAGNEDDDGPAGFRWRWRLMHAIGPILVAAFANSPLREGKPTGWRSARQQVWNHLDPGRTRPPCADGDPREVIRQPDVVAAYLGC